MPLRLTAFALTIIALFAMGMSACPPSSGTGPSDDDDGGTPTPTATATPTATPTNTPTDTPVTSTGTIELVSNAWGFCIGLCRIDLTISGTELTAVGSDYQRTQILNTNTGTLTDEGVRNLLAAEADLAAQQALVPTYGCPDCADGGSTEYQLNLNGSTSNHLMEYYNSPPPFTVAESFVQPLIQSLTQCAAGNADLNIDAGCTPF